MEQIGNGRSNIKTEEIFIFFFAKWVPIGTPGLRPAAPLSDRSSFRICALPKNYLIRKKIVTLVLFYDTRIINSEFLDRIFVPFSPNHEKRNYFYVILNTYLTSRPKTTRKHAPQMKIVSEFTTVPHFDTIRL